ncbi:MAG: hypothetical protein AAF496_17115 [Pseudomonadota bacterium]
MNLHGNLRIPLIYGLYWSAACLFLGILAAPMFTSAPVGQAADTGHGHGEIHSTVEVDPDSAPKVSIRVVRDTLSGWNVFLEVDKFTFAPERVNQANAPNEGHAHLYLNGQKVTRLYGTAFHLSDLPPGRNVISVGLNANDHSDLVLNGQPIGAEVVVVTEEE